MASQLNVSQSTFGVASDGDVNIGGNLVVGGSYSEESFEELDPPRESDVFKGREEDIHKLEALLFREGKRKVVIHGLPGFGKTELAVQFAKHCKDSKNIDEAFWINAETPENLKRHHKTLKKIYKMFETKCCLLIFDNGISRSSIRQYEPPNVEHFYLLITSHIADWDDDIYQMPLKPLNVEASLDVFRAILRDRHKIDEENVYKKMITFVSNVPLGLIVIAGHLRVKIDACTQRNFDINNFFGEISKMLNTKIHHCQSSYERSIYAAMCVALDKIFLQEFAESELLRELIKKLLGICAYLNPDRIYIREIEEIMECSDKNLVDECVYLSKNFSFVEYNKGIIKIHRLCQRILKLYFDEFKEDYYSICLRWVLRKENYEWLNGHTEIILMEADNKKETILEIYQQSVSDNHYLHIEKLLKLLVQYGCCESCEFIFHKISFKKGKEFVDKMKLLLIAIENHEEDVLKLLLEYADLNVQDSEGKTLLHIASWKGNGDIVRLLLQKGANMNIRDSDGITPLHLASLEWNKDTVRMLLQEGADVDVLDFESKTPLHWASWEGDINVFRILLDKGADVNVQDNKGKTPLHWASQEGNEDIVRMLLEKGADVNVQDGKGKTPLHWPSQQGNEHIVRMLLDKGADVHVRESIGKTPLHLASQQRNIHIVRMLLEKRADVNVQDGKGQTPLHWPSWRGDINAVRMLLEAGADVNVRDSESQTPLHWASWSGDINTVRMLLEAGADVNVRDSEGKTPLHWTSEEEVNEDLVRKMLEKRADVNVRDNKGKTPLHLASEKGNINIVRMLLEKRADVNVLDNEGKTPLYWASWEGQLDRVRLLLEKKDNKITSLSLDCVKFCGHTDIINILQKLMNN